MEIASVCFSGVETRFSWLVTGTLVEKETTTWLDDMGVIRGVV